MKKVFIFGAGSSVDFGLPLANRIFSYSDKVLQWKSKERAACLKDAIDKTEKHLRVLYTNISKNKEEYPAFEEVLTLIWNNGPFKNGWITQDVFNDFVNLLGLTIAASMGVVNYNRIFFNRRPKYEQFIGTLINTKEEIVFISLNYDILLDTILMKKFKKSHLDYGVQLRDIDTYKIYKPGRGLILKPHGSLNLSYCMNCDDIFYFEDNIFTAIANHSSWVMCPICKTSEVKPIIVPPIHNKADFIKSRKQPFIHKQKKGYPGLKLYCDAIQSYCSFVHAAIVSHLSDADEITIIGYSLPSYDLDFKHTLLKGLSKNRKRSKIKINLITKEGKRSDNEIKEPYSHLAGPVVVKNKSGFYNYICDNVL